ncbi:hypothetical protein GQ54DRAFT_300294 [Martensiomyces pterosporus]|nr:hypothetical protein GQ54DRAFT_300294 [Martensiomyces pterosporus]
MADDLSSAVYSLPAYLPSKTAANVVAAIYCFFASALITQSIICGKYKLTRLVTLIALMLGGAFIARGIYASQDGRNGGAFTAFSVLDSLAPNFINLVNYILLITLLRSISYPPSEKLIKGLRYGSVVLAIVFGALGGAGAGLLSNTAPASQNKTAMNLIKVSVAGQVANSVFFNMLISYFFCKYEETRRYGGWVTLIVVGGVLILARNCVRIVSIFYPKVSLMRTNEAAWYCLDPLFTLIIIGFWVLLNLPARCYLRDPRLPFNSKK